MEWEELEKHVQEHGSTLPFRNDAYKNKDKTTQQFCFGCLGQEKYGKRAHVLRIRSRTRNGKTIYTLRLSKEWTALKQKLGAAHKKRLQKIGAALANKKRRKGTDPAYELTVHLVEEFLQRSPMLAAAADYVQAARGTLFLSYCCPKCRTFPSDPRFWLRINFRANRTEQELIDHSANPDLSSKIGRWICPWEGCGQP